MDAKTAKRNRRKGHDFEREVVNVAKSHGFEAERGLQYRGGEEAPDVSVETLHGPLWIECKVRKNFSSASVCALLDDADAVAIKILNKGTFYAMSPDRFWRLLAVCERERRFSAR